MFGRKKNKQDIDISAPHDGSFRRGVHIEEIDGSGELVGVPKIWEQAASDGQKKKVISTETDEAPASLIPTTSVASAAPKKKKKRVKKKQKASDFELSAPRDFRQTVHVDFNSETGFSGLPPEWDALLKSSDISKEDVINNSTAVISALEFYENGYKPAAEVPKKPTPVPAKEKPVDVKNEPAEKLEPAKEDPKLREDRREQLDIDALTESEWIDEGDPEEFYSEITKVGEGSAGEVFRAVCNKTGETVAIKVISLGGEAKLEDIKNEIMMMKLSQHENVVKHMGTYMKDNKLWAVMEYMDGGALTEVISICQISEPQIACICKEVRFICIITI